MNTLYHIWCWLALGAAILIVLGFVLRKAGDWLQGYAKRLK